MLNSQQKKYLKAEAHALKPIFQVGKDGVTSKQCDSINDALKAKELIKVKLLNNCPMTPNEAAIEISAMTKADVVQIIGHTIVLYKRSPKGIYRLP